VKFNQKGTKNLFYVGLGQPRYGAGPLLTVGADLVAKVVILQDHMKSDFGTFLRKLGAGPLKKSSKCADILLDPHSMYKELMIARYLLILYMRYWLKII
jgi:hypothetical protein